MANEDGTIDVWFEFDFRSRELKGCYRDFDGDGIIDERLFMSHGEILAVSRSTGESGVHAMMQIEPGRRAEKIDLAPGSPEAGPFRADALNQFAEESPLNGVPETR